MSGHMKNSITHFERYTTVGMTEGRQQRLTTTHAVRSRADFLYGLCVVLCAGCSGNSAQPPTTGAGASTSESGGTASAGARFAAGGTTSAGGAVALGGSAALGGSGVGGLPNSSGGVNSAGGSMPTGTTTAVGGQATSAGSTSGGASNTGGLSSVTGGKSAAIGGGSATGGVVTGGAAATGGAVSTGGAPVSGGQTSADASTPTGHCDDLVESDILQHWSAGAADNPPATTTLSILGTGQALMGQQALRAVTNAGFDFWLRYSYINPVAVTGYDELRFAIRSLNTTPNGWQGNFPVAVLEDAAGARQTFTPTTQLLNSDGAAWVPIRVPLASGNGWQASTASIDLSRLAAIEIHADTWDYGFTLDINALSFEQTGAVCPCPLSCSQHGQCAAGSYTCLCDLGYAGPDCSACADGYTAQPSGTCALTVDGTAQVWPNAFSTSNSDPWLMAHHDDITEIDPKVLVLNFANPATPTMANNLLNSIFAAFAEASRQQGYRDATALPQLHYQLTKLVDLRDGVNGRPAAPAGYAYDNSTLYPATGSRPATYDSSNPPSFGSFDYAALFSASFAQWYNYPDPNQAGQYLDLCTLVEQGALNEVWMVASQDKPDAVPAEVLETKPLYTATGNRVPSSAERCAGNGCFANNVPFCGRSLRIGFVNYNRGPGCFMESLSHGLEHAMNHQVAPALSEWFIPFASFDLDQRYGLPFSSWYELGCTTLPATPCLTYPTQTSAHVQRTNLNQTIDPFDAICGNVHYPPNGQHDYDINNSIAVQSSCENYGTHSGNAGADKLTVVTSDIWMGPYGTLAADCDGPFLVWWWQNMPGYQSGKTFTDGRPMKSVWPLLYY